MHDRQDRDRSALDPKEDTEGKAAKQGTAYISMDFGIHQRSVRDIGESSQDLVQEFVAEALTLPLIPSGRIHEILLRLREKAKVKGHSLRRMSLTASTAGRPLSGSAS